VGWRVTLRFTEVYRYWRAGREQGVATRHILRLSKEVTLATTSKGSLSEALLAVQKDAPALQKNAINPHFKNRYISLDSLMEQVLPVLNKHGLVLVQAPSHLEDGTPALRTIIYHPASNDALDASVMPLVLDKQTPQAQGSAITYARRYALMALLALVADEDDDGESAGGRKKAADPEKTLKLEVWALAKERLGKDKPTVAQVAKVFGVKVSELSDPEVLQGILDADANEPASTGDDDIPY
jgi:hypothetical protein